MEREGPEFAAADVARPRQSAGSFLAGLAVNTALVVIIGSLHFQPVLRTRKIETGVLLAPAPRAVEPLKPLPRVRTFRAPSLAATPVEAPRVASLAPPPLVVTQPPRSPMVIAPPAAPRIPAVVTGTFEAPLAAPASPAPPPVAVAASAFANVQVASDVKRPVGSVESSGFGAAMGGSERRGGNVLVASAGFGSSAPATSGGARAGAPVSAGFDTAASTAQKARTVTAAVPPGGAFHSVEILAKPRPEYTEEGRRLRIEGEVWLEVLFGADGLARVQRVVRPLGHGLDESAMAATRQIRFRPAREGSRTVDQVATVRVQFQLAE